MRFAILLVVFAGCANVRARGTGTWAGDTHAETLITAAANKVGIAVEVDDESRAPLCDENDPPHTCPGTTPGPLSPPPRSQEE